MPIEGGGRPSWSSPSPPSPPQVNVYSLGRTFLSLAKELCINAPAIGTHSPPEPGHVGQNADYRGRLFGSERFNRLLVILRAAFNLSIITLSCQYFRQNIFECFFCS